MNLNDKFPWGSRYRKYRPAGKKFLRIWSSIYLEAAFKFLWPGEKKGSFKGISLKTPPNQAFQGNQREIKAEIEPTVNDLSKVNPMALTY